MKECLTKTDLLKKKLIIATLFIFLFINTPQPLFAGGAPSGESSLEVRLLDIVRIAIEKDANIRIYKSQETASAAGVLAAKAKFDPTIKASVTRSSEYTPISDAQKKAYSESGSPEVTKYKQGVFSHNIGYERLYRSGTTISPSIAVSTSESNDPENRAPRTTGKVQFAITRPLGRGNNFQANAAAEKSSKIELESASLDSLYTISQTVHDVIQSYWSYAYSYKALKVAEESKIRSEKLYNDTKILVENDELAASELDQLAANLNQKIADCEKASQALLKARNDLKVAAGVPKDSPLISGPPADFFPADRLAGDSSETALMSETLTAFAMANRKDYAAAQKRLESFKFTIPAAKDALRPQADLQITAGYNSRKDDKGAAAIISSMHEGVPGANISATVSYSFPPGNRSARAAVIKQEEQFVQAKIKAEEISRKIGINIETRISAIVSIIGRYRRTLESCRLYAKALENEKEKHRMGVSTLLDVLNTEDSLGQSELSLESIVLEYANALADLRHEAGCMGRLGTSECEIKMDDLIALPEVKNLEK